MLRKKYIVIVLYFYLKASSTNISEGLSDINSTKISESFEKCEEGKFPCLSEDVCVDQRDICDDQDDCVDGSDERDCDDEYDSEYWNRRFTKRPDSDREYLKGKCLLNKIPRGCICTNTSLFCNGADLHDVPEDIPLTVTELDLSGNFIQTLKPRHFRHLTNLKKLLIIGSDTQIIESGTFHNNKKLIQLFFSANKLRDFANCTFCGLSNLSELVLTGNRFVSLETGMFEGLERILTLKIESNGLREIHPHALQPLKSLQYLHLGHNSIQIITTEMFRYIPQLRVLFLEVNEILHIEDGAFSHQIDLQTLGLGKNKLTKILANTFRDLKSLRMLNLGSNHISEIEQGAFNDTVLLSSLTLQKNYIRHLPSGLFNLCQHLTHIYFDYFQLCLQARHVRVCEPKGDGISNHERLLANIILRVTVWIVAFLSCFGNIIVILGRFLLTETNKMHSWFIKNLAMADFLMGVYLFVIASYDVKYRSNYIYYERQWRHSWQCNFCGIISTLSSEVSVMILFIITFDRYICVLHPLNVNHRSQRFAYSVTAVIWLACAFISILPVVGIGYFGGAYYRNNGACLPLHIYDPYGKGWQYSAFIFVGLNAATFLFIVYAYSVMFYTIKKSNIAIRSSQMNKEVSLARRFAFIVFSDAVCWTPIIVIKILALTGMEINQDLHAWVAVFVLPVNSALNPIIYTLTTQIFKENLIQRMYYLCGRLLNTDSRNIGTGSAHTKHSRTIRKIIRKGREEEVPLQNIRNLVNIESKERQQRFSSLREYDLDHQPSQSENLQSTHSTVNSGSNGRIF